MRILAVNAGSSSLKLSLVGPGDQVLDALVVDRWEDGDTDSIEPFVDRQGRIDAVVHRVVHGGQQFRSPTVIDSRVLSQIESLVPLAPLHQARSVTAIRTTRQIRADLPEVACFDTAFHASMPEANRLFALPAAWRERWPLVRFGFHGLSHSYSSRRGPEIAGLPREDRIIICHLGSGASVCAVRAGRSVDTTMGFTPLDGLIMGTRCGAVDPGLLLWLLQFEGVTADQMAEGLEHRSGLAGLSGTSGDMREVITGDHRGDAACRMALATYLHRLAQGVAAMAASIAGVDLLVFTGGVGEHVPQVRLETAARLTFLGIAVDPVRNSITTEDGDISANGSSTRVVVVTAREDVEMAREARLVLGA